MCDRKVLSKGATLIDLLVAIVICTLLMALILPAVQQARSAARTVECLNNARQIGVASISFHEIHGHLPTKPLVSVESPGWAIDLLPHLEQAGLWKQFDPTLAIDAEINATAASIGRPPSYRCPANPDFPLTVALSDAVSRQVLPNHYVGNAGVLGLRLAQIKQPTHTMLARDSGSSAIFWHSSPVATVFDDGGAVHPGGTVVVYVSGRAEVRRNGDGILIRSSP